MFFKKIVSLLTVISVITLTGCVAPSASRPNSQNAMDFAADQAQEMNTQGGKFMADALGAHVCKDVRRVISGENGTKLTVGGQGVESGSPATVNKSARIQNRNGGVSFAITYSGYKDSKCE